MLIPAGQERVLEQEDGKKRFVQVVTELSRAFALCAACDEATEIRDDVSYFQAIQSALNKKSGTSTKSPEQVDAAIRQLVSMAITTPKTGRASLRGLGVGGCLLIRFRTT